MTEHLKLDGSSSDERAIARVAAALERGAVVALPTDTVYGLACRSAFPDSVQRIFALKGRPGDKALPWLIPDLDAASVFVNDVPPKALRLMRRFWPGPLTLVLGAEGQTVALRLPDHAGLREILRHAGGPVVATSANRSGEKPATTAAGVAAAFGDAVDVVVDGGPAALGRESSIVRVAPDGAAQVLREGYLSAEALRDALVTTVLFLCTGNSCRSPMAAAILQRDLAARPGGHGEDQAASRVGVESAGLLAADGAPASPGAVEAARREGLNLERHRTRQLTPETAAEADLLYAMSFEHLLRVQRLFPEHAGRAQILDPSGADVADPFGGPVDDYVACFRHLEALIRARIPEIERAAGLSSAHKKS